MKMKCISTRVFAVFAAVLLITALSIPAFAATSYVFSPPDSGYFYGEEFRLPSGRYHIKSSFSYEGISYSLFTLEPVLISYTALDFNGEHYDSAFLIDIPLEVEFDFLPDADCIELFGSCVPWGDSYLTILRPSLDGNPVAYLGATIEFIPVGPSISLSDYLSADTLPAIFNEITALLPIALGVIVGYIAIRKGIAYLQNFLHSS